MNYAGKFDAALSLDGPDSRAPGHVHVDTFTAKGHGHVPEGAFVVSDPNLIFNAEFKRAGPDLVLSHDGHEVVVHDYFRGDKRAAIASPDGAHLTGDIVTALTGQVDYAQAGPGAAAAQVIGHITKLVGSATAVRNGVSIILNNGDNVEKGDVVSTGADSTLGITFMDGTVFGLSSNARMVLNEMVYDPNGSNNSSLLSLVAGTITFVAGETAKHGDMKIDTPVATMGIRGTAVLTQIDFVVPAGGGDPQPQASFQVLVEPNGTTGSYILFDKVTLLPIATVNQAGQMIQISGGNVSVTNALMSPDVQKLITDVFTLKFTDNGTNTKLTSNFTDSITQDGNIFVIKTPSGATATPTFANLNAPPSQSPSNSTDSATRIPGPPLSRSLDLNGNVISAFKLTEHAGATGDRSDTTGDTVGSDTISGRITFVDQNLGDRPTVSVSLADAPNYVYKNAGQQDVTGSLTALQKQDIAATLIQINVAADPGNNNNGSAVWTYTIPDHVFDFLAAGETLTLTYMVRVNDNFAVNPETTTIPITITITGTNDKPVIITSVPTVTFEGGTSVPGGPLTSDVPTSGTLTFKDVDLTDTHTVAVKLTSATLPDGSVPPGPLALLESAMSVAIADGSDSTGSGTGTINWSLADLPVYLADFIPKNEVLTLVYTVTVTDSQGATSQQTITVTITGTDAPAVVWVATNHAGTPSGGFWKDAANWETGTVPTINDDVIVITDQLHGLTPSYPVTIDAAAYGKSLTMNDFGGPPPEVINESSLTIAGALDMSADSIFTNSATGTMSVGGKAEILDTAVFTNAGYLTLAGGGDFASGTSISNSGTIELSGGTLKTLAEIHNAGGTLKIDSGTTLIADTVIIAGGTVTILGTLELDGTNLIENGTLNNSGVVNVKGAAEFANETVANEAGGAIEVWANHALKIDQGSSVDNAGNVKVDASGKLTINGGTIDGGAITILPGTPVPIPGKSADTDGTLIITIASSIGTVRNNGEIDLTGNGVLSNGILNNDGILNASGTGNALNAEAVTNAGTIEVLAGALGIGPASAVDNSTGKVIVDAALTLDGATISGGAISGDGRIDVVGASKIDGGATLSTSAVAADARLTLDGITVSGSVITDNASIELDNTVQLTNGARIQGGPVTNTGTLKIAGSATLLNDIVTNTGTVQVEDDGTLKLSGTEITGGIINNYSSTSGGTIDVTGNSTIDGNATLNKGAVTVESGVELTLDDATVTGTEITNGGTVRVDASKKLTLAGASLTGGALTIAGTLASSGATTITDANILISYLLESTLGGLLALVATTSTPAITNDGGTIRANNAELDINGEAVANTGTLAAINDGTLKLISMTVTNTYGAVSIESGSTLDLSGTTVKGGTLTIAGTLESTGTSAINEADITNTGTITVTSGKLTIDPAAPHTITNSHVIQANGGELDISGEPVSNTADLKAINGGILKLSDVIVTNDSGTVTVDGTSKLYLSDASAINGGQLSNSGHLYGVSGANAISAAVANTGTIEVQGGTLNLDGGLTGVGTLVIDDGATLELAGADAQTVTFGGGADTLQLDKVTGQSFTGTMTGQASNGGTFTIKGAADINTSSGDALDFTASGGTSLNSADIVLTPTGALSGADTGVAVTQNGIGKISLTTVGDVTGTAGDGIVLHDGATGSGDITATIGGNASGSVGLDVLANGNGDVSITNNGHITGTASFGISVVQDSDGATGSTHVTNAGSVVGADGIAAICIQENATGTALIDNSGTIGPDAAHVTSTTSAIFETGGAITINNTGHIDGNISVATATFNNEAAGTWTVSGTSVFGALSTIDNAGEIDLLGGALVSSADGLTFGITNFGTIESWGTNSITGTITNTNTIEVHSGTLTLFGSLSGAGSVTIDTDATLAIDATVSQTVTFAGDGAELSIKATDFGGSIAGLAETDKIDLSSIEYGLGTSAVYVSNESHTGGVLTITDEDGHHISLTLTGADYSNATFAGSDDGTGHTLITLNAADDAPNFTTAGASQTAEVSELASTTGSPTLDPAPAATGSIDFKDVDLTDRPIATITDQSVTWLDTDGTTHLTLTGQEAALEQALTLQQAGNNNGTVAWTYSVADSALDFLGEGQTATVLSTVTLHDAHNKTDTAQVTITITGKNDAPAITTEKNDSAGADLTEANAGQAAQGTLTLSDADATDHVTVAVDHLQVYLDGVLQTDGLGDLSNATLLNYLSVQAGDVLDGTGTHAQFSWDFNSGGQPFDFLAAGHTLSLQYTITPDDGHTTTGTAGVVTINIAGSNDAPTLDAATLASVSGDDSNPSGSAVSDLFASKFHDADDGASLNAVAVTADNASEGQGAWQYEVAGSDQWVDISGVSDAKALVLSTDTLVRFVPANGFSGTPGTLDVHAIDDTYTGSVTANSPVSIDITNAHGGTTPVSDQAASIGTNVTAPVNVETAVAPVLSLGPDTTVSPTDGAALKTTLSLHAGDIVSLDWNFTTDDYLPYNDFGFASVNGAAFLLSDIQATGSYGSTGWHTFTYTVPTDGIYTFGAGVMNDKDQAVTSFLAVDNIRVDGKVVQSFENGLGETSVTGQVAVVTTAQSDVNNTQIVPTDGNHEAFLSSYPTYETSIEGFLGLSAGELSNVAKSEGPEHTPINVPITVTIPTNAHPDDTYVTISGAPAGSEFNQGAYDAGTNTWHIEATDLGGNLTLTTPVGYVGNFSLTVTATSVVYGSNTSATTSPETHAVTIDPLAGPQIDTTHFVVSENPDGTTTVLGVSITDADPAAPSETFMLSALTMAAGSSVAPHADVGNLNSVNTFLANGITYDPGEDNPAADMVTFKVTDSFGASDTVNFVFKGNDSGADSLVGTTGKDVLFATKSSDMLNGNGGQDQFVFAPATSSDTVQHTVLGFDTTLDKIDVRQFGNIHTFSDITIVQQLGNTLVTLDGHDTILLKNTLASNLHAGDFILHA